MKDTPRQRSEAQNRSLHLYCQQVADALNDGGFDVRATLKEGIEIPWTMLLVKELLWRTIQKLLIGKASTTEMSPTDPTVVFETMNRNLGEKYGIHVPWPSLDSLIEREEN